MTHRLVAPLGEKPGRCYEAEKTPTSFFQRKSPADAEMEKEAAQETERLVDDNLVDDNVRHSKLHIVKAQPVSQVRGLIVL